MGLENSVKTDLYGEAGNARVLKDSRQVLMQDGIFGRLTNFVSNALCSDHLRTFVKLDSEFILDEILR